MDKDVMIIVRSTIRGKNSKGGDRTQLYLTKEAVADLIASLTELKNAERGVKFDLHTHKKTAQESGRQFDSSFFFVKEVSESSSAPVAKKFTPKDKQVG